jgi:hypothetical protein
MKKAMLAAAVVLCGAAHADGPSPKAGLWELTVTRQTHDGQDMTAQRNAAQERMRQMMDKMSPAQRKQMEAMIGARGGPMGAAGGSTRICVSPAMAARDKPMVDPQGRCEPGKLTRSGKTSTYEFNCKMDGRQTTGVGKSTIDGDTVTTSVDMTSTDGSTTHKTQMESKMKYLGADCQGVKPMDEFLKNAPGKAK